MRPVSRLLSILSILFLPLLLRGQQAETPTGPEILARLAYDTTAVTSRENVRHVCLSITNEGEYRIIRSTLYTPTQYLHGRMSKDQFQDLKNLLSSKEFRSQRGNIGLIRQESESFGAEMPVHLSEIKKRADGTYALPPSEAWRLEWINADETAPFPESVGKVVNWLQNFQPNDAKEFSYAEFPDVCPFGVLRLLQPSIADNR